MRSVFLILPMMVLCFGARAQEGVKSSAQVNTPLSKESAIVPHSSRSPGSVSRFQREIIAVPKNKLAANHSSAAAQYFDDAMDHLEMLMAAEIKKNNEIALLQEKIPGYKF